MKELKDYSDPASFAKADEHSHQVALMAACAQYAWNGVPELRWFFAVPNGGSRGDSEKSARIQGALMKAEGVKKGVADCCLPVARHGYHGFFIEMKRPGTFGAKQVVRKDGSNEKGQSKEQIAFEGFAMEQGYLYAVFENWWSAFRALMWYLGFEHTRAWALPDQ